MSKEWDLSDEEARAEGNTRPEIVEGSPTPRKKIWAQGAPIGVIFCRHTDEGFKSCNDGHCLRAVGNLHHDFPNEELWYKHCQIQEHPLGTCSHQALFGWFPTSPRYFYQGRVR